MPLKLNVGLSKKVGLPDYGSAGASVNLEVEVDSCIAGDADRLRDRIRSLFIQATAAVNEELAGHTAGEITSNGKAKPATNGHTGGRSRDNTRRATASQVRALNAIAERRQLDLAGLLAERFGTRDPAELSIVEASQLIDECKGAGSSSGGRR